MVNVLHHSNGKSLLYYSELIIILNLHSVIFTDYYYSHHLSKQAFEKFHRLKIETRPASLASNSNCKL